MSPTVLRAMHRTEHNMVLKANAMITKRDRVNGFLTLTTRRAALALGACAVARPSVADAANDWSIGRLPTPTP